MMLAVPVWAQVDIIVDSYPEDSPTDLKIYVTGSFNDWQAAEEQYRLKLNEKGKFHIRLENLSDSLIEFKFTAGSWALIESDHNSLPRPNRKINTLQTSVYHADIYNWQEANRGEGSSLFIFGIVTACLLSALLLALFHKSHGKIELADFRIPSALIALSIIQGWFFLNYNTYQWHPVLAVMRWISLASIVLTIIYLYKTQPRTITQYIFAVSILVLIAGILSGWSGNGANNGLTGIENYLSIFVCQYFLILLGITGLRKEITPTPVQAPPDKDTLPIANEFDQIIHREQVYTDQELTLEKLASQMGLHRNLLSKVINEHYGKSFSEFMIELRVQAFIDLASEPGMIEQYTFFGLAQKAGFNSKSAFNRAFKKITDQTPTQYFQAVPSSR